MIFMECAGLQRSWKVYDWSGVKSTNPSLGFWDRSGWIQRIRESFRLEKSLKILEPQNSGWKTPPRWSPTLSKCHVQFFVDTSRGGDSTSSLISKDRASCPIPGMG